MTGVTHGGDAARLREIATVLRGEGLRVKELGDGMGPFAQVLEGSWSGPDSAALLADVDRLRPAVASVGATLIVWADELRAQADEQTQASGEAGGAGGRSGPGGSERSRRSDEVVDDVRDLANRIMGDGDPQGQGMRNPLLAALDPGARPGRQGGADASSIDPFDALFGEKIPGFEGPKGSHSKSLGKGVSIETSGSATRDDAGLNDQGQRLESTTVTGKAEVSAEGGKRMGKVGLDAKGFAGTENSYTVTGVKGTDLTDANPFDPEGMPEGSKIRLDSSWYAGYELDGKFKHIVAEMGEKSGKEHYVEVIRGEGDEVTVRIGNDKFDEASSATGLGLGPASGTLDTGGSSFTGTAKEVTFDLSTQEGQDAYDRFVLGGKAPSADAAGVVDVSKVEAFGAEKHAGMSANWGDKSLSVDWVKHDTAGGVSTTHADGGKTVEWASRREGSSQGGSVELDPDGKVKPGSEQIHIRRTGVDPGQLSTYMENVHGQKHDYSEPQNVVINYTKEDLRTLRLQAAEYEAQELNAGSSLRGSAFEDRQDWTAAEVLERIDSSDDARGSLRPALIETDSLLWARSDDELIDALAQDPVVVQTDAASSSRGAGKEPAPVGTVKVHPSQ